jgi:hypothetical protein
MAKKMTLMIMSLPSTAAIYREYNAPYVPREGETVWVESDRFKVKMVVSDFTDRIIRCYVEYIQSVR